MIAVTFVVDWVMMNESDRALRIWSVKPMRWALYYACVYSIVFFGVFEHMDFIYFRF